MIQGVSIEYLILNIIFRTLGMPGRYCTHGLECNEKDCNTRSIIEKGKYEFFVATKISKCNKTILICSFKANNRVFEFDSQKMNMFKSIIHMFDSGNLLYYSILFKNQVLFQVSKRISQEK